MTTHCWDCKQSKVKTRAGAQIIPLHSVFGRSYTCEDHLPYLLKTGIVRRPDYRWRETEHHIKSALVAHRRTDDEQVAEATSTPPNQTTASMGPSKARKQQK